MKRKDRHDQNHRWSPLYDRSNHLQPEALLDASFQSVYHTHKGVSHESTTEGFGSHVSNFLSDKNLLDRDLKLRTMILPDKFIDQDKPDLMYKFAGLDGQSIENKVLDLLNSNIVLQKQK